MDYSAIMCDEFIDSYDKGIYNKEAINLYILLSFLLITIVLLIAVSIHWYLIKYHAMQKQLLPFLVTNNELK